VKGVLFDFGNTLFTHASLAVTIGQCARQLRMQLTDEHAAALAHRIDSAAMAPDELAFPRDLDPTVWRQRWLVLYGMADEDGTKYEGLGEAIYANMHAPSEWIPYPQSAATLRSLGADGLAIGVVSNTGWDVRSVFAEHEMSQDVTSFTLSYEAGFVKPARAIFDAACASLGLAPHELVMVGDDPVADSGAVRVGIRTLLVPARPPGIDNGVADVLKLIGIAE
jgi:FMN phosphatase YigB (HAD superfamily)